MLTIEMTDLLFARDAVKTGRAADIRRGTGFSQEEIAQAVTVSAPTISRWEGGTRRPRGAAGERYGRLLRELERLASEAEKGEL